MADEAPASTASPPGTDPAAAPGAQQERTEESGRPGLTERECLLDAADAERDLAAIIHARHSIVLLLRPTRAGGRQAAPARGGGRLRDVVPLRARVLAVAALTALASACAGSGPGPMPVGDGGVVEDCGGFLLTADLRGARDLGGVVTGKGATRCRALLRGPALSPLGAASCSELQRLGVRTIIDLRTAAERSAAPDDACTAAAATVVAPLPIPYNLSPSDYLADLHASESLRLVFTTLGADAAYPAYVHCTYGRDRTGVVSALALSAVGVPRDVVLAEYQRTAAAGYATAPASLEAVLDEIARAGGAPAVLRAAGVPDEALETLQRRLGP